VKEISTKNGASSLSEDRWIIWVCALVVGALYLAAGIVLLCSFGCASTVRPKIAQSAQASWDGTEQNSGLIGIAPDGRRIITAHARERYSALMKDYGKFFERPVTDPNEGITPTGTNTFLIDPQHEEYFIDAIRWEKQKRPPWDP